MATHWFNEGVRAVMAGEINFASDDIRAVLLMTNTTADTENDGIVTVSQLATLDEFDGSGYTTGGGALDSQAVNKDDGNNRAEFDSADETWSSLGAGTRSILGILIIKFVTNLGASLPIAFLEFASAKTPDGSDFTVQWNAEGICQLTVA